MFVYFKVLYKNSIIHRDIKPENILIHEGVIKISDFGYARVIYSMENPEYWSLVGTPLYMSTQILTESKFSSKCDVWSTGIVFYELLYGITPWFSLNPQVLLNKILKDPLVFPNEPIRSQKIKKIISEMLGLEEKDRINWQSIFENELFKIDPVLIFLFFF